MAQIAEPTGTISNDAPDYWWAGNNVGGNLNIYQEIDEPISSADDNSTYIQAAYPDPFEFTSTFEVIFDTLQDPTVHTGHNLKIRTIRRDFALSNQSLDVSLYQGATLIYNTTVTATSSYVTNTLTLSEAQAANITNYSDLRCRVSYTHTTAENSPKITSIEFEVPDVGGGGGGGSGVAVITTPGAFVLFL